MEAEGTGREVGGAVEVVGEEEVESVLTGSVEAECARLPRIPPKTAITIARNNISPAAQRVYQMRLDDLDASRSLPVSSSTPSGTDTAPACLSTGLRPPLFRAGWRARSSTANSRPCPPALSQGPATCIFSSDNIDHKEILDNTEEKRENKSPSVLR